MPALGTVFVSGLQPSPAAQFLQAHYPLAALLPQHPGGESFHAGLAAAVEGDSPTGVGEDAAGTEIGASGELKAEGRLPPGRMTPFRGIYVSCVNSTWSLSSKTSSGSLIHSK